MTISISTSIFEIIKSYLVCQNYDFTSLLNQKKMTDFLGSIISLLHCAMTCANFAVFDGYKYILFVGLVK